MVLYTISKQKHRCIVSLFGTFNIVFGVLFLFTNTPEIGAFSILYGTGIMLVSIYYFGRIKKWEMSV